MIEVNRIKEVTDCTLAVLRKVCVIVTYMEGAIESSWSGTVADI